MADGVKDICCCERMQAPGNILRRIDFQVVIRQFVRDFFLLNTPVIESRDGDRHVGFPDRNRRVAVFGFAD